MKISNKALKYKITCTILACKVQCEHIVHTSILTEDKTYNLLQQVLARRGKEE